MKKNIFLAIALTLSQLGAVAQTTIDQIFADRSEVVFSFVETDRSKIGELSRIISIDKRRGDTITAYANRQEFQHFMQKGYKFTVIPQNNEKAVSMASTVAQMSGWDRYPTYEVYLQMMDSFAIKYPALCRIDTIGTSINGRLILCAVISDSLNADQNEPQFFYTSTMHGDEVTGYILMLRLIDHLLSNYGTDARITQLVNTTRIYINPLSNPDGTYKGGNSNIARATRYNAAYVDLNRNFPDPFGTAPLNATQRETTAMMDYASNHHFVMSANLHGGSEVVNFPWDSYTSGEKLSADYNWWQAVGRKFVDSCRAVRSNAYTSDYRSGTVVGGNWYVINNGRQDYMNYYHHCKEATIEVSEDKTLSSALLPTYWNFHRQALIDYIDQVHRGIHGLVVDSVTRQPLKALITTDNYDSDSSNVWSRAGHGDFYRPLLNGQYSITATAQGYLTKTIENIAVADTATKMLIELVRDNSPVSIANPENNNPISIYPNPCNNTLTISGNFYAYRLVNAMGQTIKTSLKQCQNSTTINMENLPKGIYFLEITHTSGKKTTHKVVKK